MAATGRMAEQHDAFRVPAQAAACSRSQPTAAATSSAPAGYGARGASRYSMLTPMQPARANSLGTLA